MHSDGVYNRMEPPTRAGGTRLSTALLSCALMALCLTGGVQRKAATLNRDATDAFKGEKFEDASQLYSDALTHEPESNSISYNLGNALHRTQRLEDAVAALTRAAQSEDPALRQSALHNLGNTLYRMGKLPEAVDAYRRALMEGPADLDTKINFEKALRLLQEQEQEQKQEDQQQQDQQDQQEGEEGQDDKAGDPQDQEEPQEGQQDEEQPQQEEQQGEQDEGSEGSEGEEQPPPPEQSAALAEEGELSFEEAKRLLDAMRDQEREQQRKRAEKVRARTKRVGKDW